MHAFQVFLTLVHLIIRFISSPNLSLFSEIYRIVSQKQITDEPGMDKPGGSQTINLQPTLTDSNPTKKPCCNT